MSGCMQVEFSSMKDFPPFLLLLAHPDEFHSRLFLLWTRWHHFLLHLPPLHCPPDSSKPQGFW